MYLILWLRFCYCSCDANAMAKKMFSAQIIHSQAEITVNKNAVAPDFSLINWKTSHIWKQLYDPGNRGCRNVALSGHLCDNTSQIWLWYDRTSEFIKIKNSNLEAIWPPLLAAASCNLVKRTSIYRARWASFFNEEASRFFDPDHLFFLLALFLIFPHLYKILWIYDVYIYIKIDMM